MIQSHYTHYHAYVGNVSYQNYRTNASGVVWEKSKRYTETQIADMLNKAYQRGRVEAIMDINEAIAKVRK